jgi:hypothetical protein
MLKIFIRCPLDLLYTSETIIYPEWKNALSGSAIILMFFIPRFRYIPFRSPAE